MIDLKITKLGKVKTPHYSTDGSAAIDFYLPDVELLKQYFDDDSDCITIHPHCDVLLPSGIKIIIPEGYCLHFINKSGIASKQHLVLGAQLVDDDYRGEILFHLYNFSNNPISIHADQKIVQGKIEEKIYGNISEISQEEYNKYQTVRGEGGFGSTGI